MIENSIFKKMNNCPLCRLEINTNNSNELNLRKGAWSIISDSEINKKESLQEMEIMFTNALSRMIDK